GEISYDKLIIALGYSQRLLPNTEKLETVEDALRIREKMLKARRVVILGGGLLGVELASLAREMNKETYLIEGQSKLLGFMSKDSSEYAKMKLEDMGVNILLNTKVDSIDGNVVKTNKDTIKADLIISSIGFKGPSLISDLKLSNVNDRMIVDEYLKSIDYDEVYGAGDCATNNKKFIPMSAQVAVQAGTRAMLNALGQEEKFS
ncbi:pyridine nucleotide-disulfide oxidoreductase, partial [Sulfolobus sp. E3]